ncbi:MAG TPA: bacteriohemerythrin [Clostridia bacterium]|nr:bacteriohemerythrin [Clostridia bacterium]
MITWREEYSVGYEEFDDQHKKLISIINEIQPLLNNDDIGDEKLYVEISDVLSKLLDYTEYHFESEEELFEKYDYKHTAEHKELHHRFFMKITELLANLVLDEDLRGIVSKTDAYLKEWLLSHIQGADQKYTNELN